MKIAIDVDGVLADFIASFTAEIANRYPEFQAFDVSKQKEWDLEWCASDKQIRTTWDLVNNTPEWWLHLKPLVSEETFDRIDHLVERHYVYFLSNRAHSEVQSVQWQTHEWLFNHGVVSPNVVITKDKLGFCEAMGIEWMLEDRPDTLVEMAIAGFPRRTYAMDRPYNSILGVPRVHTVDEFLDHIEREENKREGQQQDSHRSE